MWQYFRDERLVKLRNELNSIYLERQKQLDKIYEEYEEFKVAPDLSYSNLAGDARVNTKSGREGYIVS